MEDQAQEPNHPPTHASERNQPVRSRWTPKPEQILILESIFNSGMVNPSKDETVRIRRLLEKLGAVGDANVFYWFQNRRSRSRRLQRQIQASLVGDHAGDQPRPHADATAIHHEGSSSSNGVMGFQMPLSHSFFPPSLPSSCLCTVGSFSSDGATFHEGIHGLCSRSSPIVLEPTEFITVFINRLPTDVPRGPLDMTAMFGEDVVLLHSSGVPVPVNEFGFSDQSLQHGESYFLVSRSTYRT
ncbi:WUSCHEL-related homeobox 6-like [Malania oleifera]|uniref:WUSCHEL-related homeobox 6-like n=1 Tax=Malania oleifera TaxID=397392 RepID=UPI0025ADA604|nr:WUSCHEL-related homeobox 6-like [Malania oleifera]